MSIYHLTADRLIASPSRCTVEKMLIENEHIIETIALYQGKGRAAEAAKYQALLHRNLVVLARLADAFRARQPAGQTVADLALLAGSNVERSQSGANEL